MISETQPVRVGEELEAERLAAFLKQETLAGDDDIEITQFSAGSSNLTYLLRTASGEYVLRRPPFGNTVKGAHDMRREFAVLTALSKVFPAPRPLIFCEDDSVIGSEFYLMERRHGVVLRGAVPENVRSSSDLQREICRSFIRNLSDLHSLDIEKAGLTDLGSPQGYVRRQVEGWSKRYWNAKTHEWHELERGINWLTSNIPEESGASIVHNDYKFDNVMLDSNDLTKITAVLDWEMVTVGDPLMDLGTTLGYWMSQDAGDEMMHMPFNPRILMENISRQDLAEMYSEFSGRDTADILYYYVFGTFKIAVIAQQIYARYVKGFTADQRFAGFDKFVGTLGTIASRAIDTGEI